VSKIRHSIVRGSVRLVHKLAGTVSSRPESNSRFVVGLLVNCIVRLIVDPRIFVYSQRVTTGYRTSLNRCWQCLTLLSTDCSGLND
jgi:hypothetical protein